MGTVYYIRTAEGESLKRSNGTLIPVTTHPHWPLLGFWADIYRIGGWHLGTVLLAEEENGDHLIVHRDGVDSVMRHCSQCHGEEWVPDELCDMCAEMAEACSKPLPE